MTPARAAAKETILLLNGFEFIFVWRDSAIRYDSSTNQQNPRSSSQYLLSITILEF